MAFKLNRPFGHTATFERPSEFFDWLMWYDANSPTGGVSGMIWNDGKPVGTVAMVLDMGRDAFLTKWDDTYTPEEDRTLEDVANSDAQDYIDQIHPPMVTYAHSSAPRGQRFRDFKGREPSWAVDIQPCMDVD